MAGSLAIRWRLTIWIALAFAFTLAAMFIALWLTVSAILNDNIAKDLARNFDEVEGRALIVGDIDDRQSELTFYPFPVAIYDPDGTLLTQSNAADPGAMEMSEEQRVGVVVEDASLDRNVTIRGEEFRVRAARIKLGEEGVGIAQVGWSRESIDDVRQTLATILIGGGAIAFLVVIVIAYWLARGALRPVDQISRVASDIEASDLKRRIGARRKPAEVQRLADTFDGMLSRLESAFSQQRNFVMDVSHELRTPLTGLRGNLDVMLMDPSLDAETRGQLEKMSSEVARLIRLTSNLLYLAHAEAGRDIARLPVELDALALEVVHQERNVRAEVTLRLAHEEAVSVHGDRDLLKQLLLNVVDNAVKYSPAGGEVVVSLARAGDTAEVVVADQGPGIPEGQAARIFDRFYRVDRAQSSTVGGAGIGLAICKWIAQAHGGDIRVESASGQGSRFIVTLPLAIEPAHVTAAAL